jgi:RNA polymerase sigma factor (TIGR02999 family)
MGFLFHSFHSVFRFYPGRREGGDGKGGLTVPSAIAIRAQSSAESSYMPDLKLAALVETAESGNTEGREELFTALYDELHRLAQRELGRNAAATLSPTTLLHETYLSISQRDSAAFVDRARFMGYAARAMRGLLIDYLRNRQAKKRGGQFEITSLNTEHAEVAQGDLDMEQLAEALDALAKIEPRLAECVDLKFFCGFSTAEIAELWAVSARSVEREWEKARILLRRMLSQSPDA